MRIGLAEKTVQMALGQAAVYSDKKSPPPKVQSPFEEVTTLLQAFIYISPILLIDLIGSVLELTCTWAFVCFS